MTPADNEDTEPESQHDTWFGDRATSLGRFDSGHPFDNPDHLWRCNDCDGLFIAPDHLMHMVGLVALDRNGGPLSAEWWEKEGARLRQNLALAAMFRDATKCRCRESGDAGIWESTRKEYDEFLERRTRWTAFIDTITGDSDDRR